METELIVELLRAFNSVLTEHCVRHEKDFVRANGVFEFAELLHQRFIDMEPSGGIDDHHVVRAVASLSHCVLTELKRRIVRVSFPQLHADIFRDYLQLIAGRGTVHVDRDQNRAMAASFQPLRELSR